MWRMVAAEARTWLIPVRSLRLKDHDMGLRLTWHMGRTQEISWGGGTPSVVWHLEEFLPTF